MNRRKALLAPLAVVLAVAAIAAPAASAYTEPYFPGGSNVDLPAQSTGIRVVEVPSDSGFQWGDAAIGAGAALALGLVGFGAALAFTSLSRRHSVSYRGASPSAS